MRFEDLFQDFLSLTEVEKSQFLYNYFKRRTEDLKESPYQKKERQSKASNNMVFSKEELQLMKVLGIKQKDLSALKQIESTTEDEDENGEEDFLDE